MKINGDNIVQSVDRGKGRYFHNDIDELEKFYTLNNEGTYIDCSNEYVMHYDLNY